METNDDIQKNRNLQQSESGDANTENDNKDRDLGGSDAEESNERHHQSFGNRKYESHTNHSSNDDQPMTDTGPTGTSPTIT